MICYSRSCAPVLLKQCWLRQGLGYKIGWVDAEMAQIGNRVELKEHEGLWTVMEVYANTMTREMLQQQRDGSKTLKSI